MPKRAAEAPLSSETHRVRPDSFSSYRSQVAKLLSQRERTSNQGVTTRHSNSGIGAGMSNVKRDKLNVLLRQCVKNLTPEVDEVLLKKKLYSWDRFYIRNDEKATQFADAATCMLHVPIPNFTVGEQLSVFLTGSSWRIRRRERMSLLLYVFFFFVVSSCLKHTSVSHMFQSLGRWDTIASQVWSWSCQEKNVPSFKHSAFRSNGTSSLFCSTLSISSLQKDSRSLIVAISRACLKRCAYVLFVCFWKLEHMQQQLEGLLDDVVTTCRYSVCANFTTLERFFLSWLLIELSSLTHSKTDLWLAVKSGFSWNQSRSYLREITTASWK